MALYHHEPHQEGFLVLRGECAAHVDGQEVALREWDYFEPHKDGFLLDIIGNTICADLLDYAKRDSHFTGLKLDYDDKRIVDAVESSEAPR